MGGSRTGCHLSVGATRQGVAWARGPYQYVAASEPVERITAVMAVDVSLPPPARCHVLLR